METLVKRILVGTDGSPAATRGVAWAAGLAGALDAHLAVATVLAPDLGGSGTADLADGRDRIVERLEGSWSAPARASVGQVTTLVLDGDPRAALLDAVSIQQADLLVLGSAGTGWFPALHLGHVAHALAHHCAVALVIVPPGATAEAPRRILVGMDGSAGSAAAVEWAGELAQALRSEVLAAHVHVREAPVEPGQPHAHFDEHCEQWAAPLRSAGITTRIVIAQGWPASAIVDLEVVEGPGLVVLGARGAGGFKDLRLGSVALQVLQRSVVPVAIVPGEGHPANTQQSSA